MNLQEKNQQCADNATVGILNDTEALLALPIEYVNLEWIQEAKEKLERIISKASQGHIVLAYRMFEGGDHVPF